MNELWQFDAAQTADLVKRGEVTADEVLQSTLGRLEAVNPAINAVVQQMPDEALAAADAVDRKLAAGEDPGPLAGVPVTVKVNIDQAGYDTAVHVALAVTESVREAELERCTAVALSGPGAPPSPGAGAAAVVPAAAAGSAPPGST